MPSCYQSVCENDMHCGAKGNLSAMGLHVATVVFPARSDRPQGRDHLIMIISVFRQSAISSEVSRIWFRCEPAVSAEGCVISINGHYGIGKSVSSDAKLFQFLWHLGRVLANAAVPRCRGAGAPGASQRSAEVVTDIRWQVVHAHFLHILFLQCISECCAQDAFALSLDACIIPCDIQAFCA